MVVMIAGIHISQEIFAINILRALKSSGASSEACSATVTSVTTVWKPGFRYMYGKLEVVFRSGAVYIRHSKDLKKCRISVFKKI